MPRKLPLTVEKGGGRHWESRGCMTAEVGDVGDMTLLGCSPIARLLP